MRKKQHEIFTAVTNLNDVSDIKNSKLEISSLDELKNSWRFNLLNNFALELACIGLVFAVGFLLSVAVVTLLVPILTAVMPTLTAIALLCVIAAVVVFSAYLGSFKLFEHYKKEVNDEVIALESSHKTNVPKNSNGFEGLRLASGKFVSQESEGLVSKKGIFGINTPELTPQAKELIDSMNP